jgi:hypothetical protein
MHGAIGTGQTSPEQHESPYVPKQYIRAFFFCFDYTFVVTPVNSFGNGLPSMSS